MAVEQTTKQAEGAKQQAQEKAQEAAGQARTRLRDQLDTRSTDAGKQVRSTAEALRSTADRLKEERQDGPARAAGELARRTEQVGTWMTDTDAETMLSDIEEFARRQPMVVVAAGLIGGFAASRFLKASSRSRYEQRAQRAPRADARGAALPPGGARSGAEGLERPEPVRGPTAEPPSVSSGIPRQPAGTSRE